jgi:hypothetical protein
MQGHFTLTIPVHTEQFVAGLPLNNDARRAEIARRLRAAADVIEHEGMRRRKDGAQGYAASDYEGRICEGANGGWKRTTLMEGDKHVAWFRLEVQP